MKVFEMNAIRVPKEATGLQEDIYMLLYYANFGTAYLSNGKKFFNRKWRTPSYDLRDKFYTKDTFWQKLSKNASLATECQYKEEGNLTIERYTELIANVFDSAKTIEEMGGIFVSMASYCKTSRDFFGVCTDFHLNMDMYFDMDELGINSDYIEYVNQPFYVIKVGSDSYYGENKQKLLKSVHQAAQYKTEEVALKITEDMNELLGPHGYEIIRIEKEDEVEVVRLLRHIN